jgi:hypothetical protein
LETVFGFKKTSNVLCAFESAVENVYFYLNKSNVAKMALYYPDPDKYV